MDGWGAEVVKEGSIMAGIRRALARFAFALLLSVVGASCGGDEPSTAGSGFSSTLQADPTQEAAYLVDLGEVPVGDRAVRVVEVTNVGDARLVVTGDRLARPFGHDLPAAGLAIEAGATSKIRFDFEPEEASDEPLGRILELRTNEGDGRVYTLRLMGRGFRASLDCEPSSLDFGPLRLGLSRSLTTVCQNQGSIPLVLRADGFHRFSGDQRRSFSSSLEGVTDGALTVEPGASASIRVNFKPDALGAGEAALEIGDPRIAPLATVSLAGEGVAHSLLVEPSGCLEFGEVALGERVTRTLSLRNSDISGIQIENASLTQLANDGAFSLATEIPFVVQSDGSTREIEVEFHPTHAGPSRSTISFRSNDPRIEGGLVTACLEGYGGGAALRCDEGPIDLDQVAVGMSASARFRCSNAGDEHPEHPAPPLLIDRLVSTSSSFQARIVHEDGSKGPKGNGYKVGEAFEVEVLYEPTTDGHEEAEIVIESSAAPGGSIATTAFGHGRALPACDFSIESIEAGQLPFGTVEYGDSLTRTLEVRNHLETPCLVYDLRLEGESADDFSVAPIRSFELPGRGALRVPVTFAPSTNSGPALGAIEFQISDPERQQQRVELTGTAAKSCLLVQPRVLDFGSVTPGCQTRERSIVVTNTCPGPRTLGPIGLDGSSADAGPFRFRDEPPAERILHPNEQQELSMIFHPAEEGESHGAVAIEVEGSAPYFFSLVGEASLDPVQRDTVQWQIGTKVDVLWVMDSTGSFAPYKEAISQNLAALLHHADEAMVDFQIAVTTGSLASSGSSGCSGGGEDGRFVPIHGNGPRILRRGTPDLEMRWLQKIMASSCSALDAPVEAAFRALSPPLINEAMSSKHESTVYDGNVGFLRKDAALSIVFVSDEPEMSTSFGRSIQDYLAFFTGLKGPDRVRIHAISGSKSSETSACNNRSGDRFHFLREGSGGTWLDICTPTSDAAAWEAGMKELSVGAFGVPFTLPLRGNPGDRTGDARVSEEDIEVFVNGALRPHAVGGQQHWTFDSASNSIRFMKGFHPRSGAEVTASYRVACADP